MAKRRKISDAVRRPGGIALLIAVIFLYLGADCRAAERKDGLLAGILADSYQVDTVKRIVGRSSAKGRKSAGEAAKSAVPHAALNANRVERLERYNFLIQRYSAQYGIDADLVKAVIYAESGGDPNAVSPKGAVGLMQLMPATATELGVVDSFDPEENIASGARHLSGLIKRYKSVPVALWAYNAGPQAVKAGRMPLETQEYVPQVLQFKRFLAQGGGE